MSTPPPGSHQTGFFGDLPIDAGLRERIADFLLSHAFEAMYLVDAAGVFVAANDAALQAFQATREEFIGHHFIEILGSSDESLSLSIFGQMALSGELDLTHEFTLRSGIRRLYKVRGRRFGDWFAFALRDESPVMLSERSAGAEPGFDAEVLIENLTEMVCLFKPDGTLIYANPAYCRYFGRSLTDLQGRSYVPAVYPEDTPRIDAALATITQEQPAVLIENRVFRSDGAVRWTQWVNRGFFNAAGHLIQLLATGRDIHEKLHAQEDLQVSEERFRLAARATRDYIWDWDLASGDVSFGEGLRLLWPGGWPDPGEAFDWWGANVHPDDRQRVLESLHAVTVSESGDYWTENYRFQREDGTWAAIVDRGYVLRDTRGRAVRVVGSMLDLSEHREIQEQLAQTQEKLQIMLQSAPMGLWEFDFRADAVYRNRALWHLIGLPPTDEPRSAHFWDAIVHPDDLDRFLQSWQSAIEQRHPSWGLEYRVRHAEGHYLHIFDSAFFVYGPDGEVTRAFGAVIDRTERHRREAELREREDSLARAQEIAHLGSWVVELGHEPHRWSDELFRIMGYEPNEVVPSMELFWARAHPDDHALINAEMDQALAGGKPYRVVHRIVRPDGKVRWVDQQCHIERHPDGSPHILRGTTLDVTERVLADAEIREREARFRTLADSSPAMIYLDDAQGAREYVNVRWTECLQSTAAELLGDHWQQWIHPVEREEIRARRAVAYVSQSGYQLDYRIRFGDGSWHWLLDTGVPRYAADGTFMGFTGSCLDITPRKTAENMQQFLAETGTLLAGTLDIDSTLIRLAQYCVPALCDMCVLNYRNTEDEPLRRLALAHIDFNIRKALQDTLPPEPTDCLVQGGLEWVMRHRRTLEIATTEAWALPPDLKPVDDQLAALTQVRSGVIVPLTLRGQVIGTLSLLRTGEAGPMPVEVRETGEEIARRIALAVDNARLYRALQQADQRKDLFLATLAHELRNPAAAILSAAQLLSLQETDEETRRWGMDLMERQGRHIGRLLDDLLDVSRITRGKVQLRLQRVDLREVVRNALEATMIQFDERGHQVIVALPEEPVTFVGDPTRLEQIVSNLLNNAAKYTSGTGLIRVGLSVDATTSEAVLSVADNGIGIDPELIPQLFEMFIQAERAMSRSQGGLGIGLTLVRMLVEMHGGAVSAQSDGPGKGSTFEVRLPLPAQLPAADQPEAADDFVSPEPLRVLVIDDNQDVAATITRLIAARGHRVTAINESTVAVSVVESTSPDLVLLDIGMPGLDGYSVARRLQELPGRERFLLIALTGFGQDEDTRLAAEAGFDGHRTKPLDRRELTAILADALQHRRRHTPLA